MPDGAWGVNANGNWSAAANWTSSVIADGATFTATFQRDITAARTVTVDTMRTIGNLVFQDTVAPIVDWVLARSLTNTLTLDNGASKPVINAPTQIIVTGVLAGTNGFEKQGAGVLDLRAVNTVSGIVTINGGSVRLGQFNTGATAFLPNISSYDLVSGVLDYRGTGVHTENSSISGTGSSTIYIVRPSTINFSNALSDFFGKITLETQTTGTTANFENNVPVNANFQINAYTTGATFGTFVFANESSANVSGNTTLFADTAQTGSSLTFTGNGTAPIEFSGTFSRFQGSNTSSIITLQFNGSSSSCSVTGRIRNTTGTPSGTLALTKSGTGTWALSNDNDYSGRTLTSAGKLVAQSNTALGAATSSAGVTVSGTGVLELAGGITLNKSSTAFTLHANNPIQSVGDNTLQTAGITLGGTTTFEVTTGNRLAIVNSGAITDGVSTFGLTKTGDGELALAAFSNTYDGAVTVSAGTLAIGSVGALGSGVATVQVTGNLKYTGATGTLSRATQLNGAAPSLEAAGTGALTVSSLSHDVTTKTVTLKGANTDANTITSGLSDNTGVLSLAKEGAGTWVTTGARTYTGTTVVNGGVLRLETNNSATASGAVTIGASGTVELVTNTLASVGATSGAVLGTGNVTVDGGTIKTRGGTTQKGQVRYGGNLTFASGSTLYIGAAA